MADLAVTLAQLPLLRGLSEETRASIAEAGSLIRLNPGDVLFRRGDLGDTLYLVLDGELHVRVGGQDGADPITVAPIRPGDVVGELALLAGVPRSADVVAMAPSALLLFDRIHALGLLGAHPVLARRVMGQIATRLALAVPAPSEERHGRHIGVSTHRARASQEAALGEVLANLSAEASQALAHAGVRDLRAYGHDGTVVLVWESSGEVATLPPPVMAVLTPLLADEAAPGAQALLGHWQAHGDRA
jgi:CRP-like cAMP-binding protein